MTLTEQDLARELARHPAWRWTDGMMSNAGRVWTEVYYPGGGTRDAAPRLPSGGKVSTGHYPDLADWPTIGCLIAMLGDRLGAVRQRGGEWSVSGRLRSDVHINMQACPTLGEALARAWLAVHHD